MFKIWLTKCRMSRCFPLMLPPPIIICSLDPSWIFYYLQQADMQILAYIKVYIELLWNKRVFPLERERDHKTPLKENVRSYYSSGYFMINWSVCWWSSQFFILDLTVKFDPVMFQWDAPFTTDAWTRQIVKTRVTWPSWTVEIWRVQGFTRYFNCKSSGTQRALHRSFVETQS